jgi:hypothetical protein
MEMLRNVVGVLDMDGFCVNEQFYCKELGVLRIGDVYAKSQFFDINMKWSELNEKVRRQCAYVIRNVHHRLPFRVPDGTVAEKLCCLDSIILEFYQRYGTFEASLLAYKGGHYERDLLKRLSIPGVNLEKYGCPRVEVLFDELGWLEMCGNHLTGNETYRHCPKVEAFGHWLSRNL